MDLDDGLSECQENMGIEDWDDEYYTDAVEESKKERSSIHLLEKLSCSAYILHEKYTSCQSKDVQSTGR